MEREDEKIMYTVPRCSSLKKLGRELEGWMEGTVEVDGASPKNRNSDVRLGAHFFGCFFERALEYPETRLGNTY